MQPIPAPGGGTIDLLVMAGFSAFLLPGSRGDRALGRPHGFVLLLAFSFPRDAHGDVQEAAWSPALGSLQH